MEKKKKLFYETFVKCITVQADVVKPKLKEGCLVCLTGLYDRGPWVRDGDHANLNIVHIVDTFIYIAQFRDKNTAQKTEK